MTCFCCEKDIVKNVEYFLWVFIKKLLYLLFLFEMKKTFVVFLTSFLSGALLSWFAADFIQENLWKTFSQSHFSAKESLDMQPFWQVYDIVEKQYFSSGSLKKEDIVSGAIAGMVEALWDKHSEFMTPSVHEKFQEALSGDFEWIGAVVEKEPLGVRVERIIKGSPAKKYDVRAKDIIIEANGESLEGLDVYDAVEKIKGPAWTQVELSILRPGEKSILKINLTREKIHIPSVEEKYFEKEKIAYIALNMFGDTTSQEFKEALNNVKKSDTKGLILDLRDNGGWYLQSAVEILSEFIPEGEVLVKTHYKDAFFDQNYFSQGSIEPYTKKIVVLMNGNSASASEITAWALREYNKAILVGEKTYGKGSVQQPFELEDGSLLKLTVAKWFTPEWKNIDADGISPDIKISYLEEDYTTLYDRQLEEAKKILEIFVEKQTLWLSIESYIKAHPNTSSWSLQK